MPKQSLTERINSVEEKIKSIENEALTKEQYNHLITMLSKEFGEIKNRLGRIEEHLSLKPSPPTD